MTGQGIVLALLLVMTGFFILASIHSYLNPKPRADRNPPGVIVTSIIFQLLTASAYVYLAAN